MPSYCNRRQGLKIFSPTLSGQNFQPRDCLHGQDRYNKAMSNLQPHILTQRRHEESGDQYARAIECLLAAEEDGFRDARPLQEAGQALIEAIRFNRQHTEAYIAMGYLLWLVGANAEALPYLEEALRLDPHHPDIHLLFERVTGKPSAPPAPVAAPTSSGDPLEDALDETLRELMEEKVAAIAPAVNGLVIERLRERHALWQERYDQLKPQVGQRPVLLNKLAPLAKRIDLYGEAIERSEQMVQLDEQIHDSLRTAEAYLEQLAQGLDPDGLQELQGYVEVLLDHCDYYADTLDAWEEQSIPVRPLARVYDQLSDALETLQAQLGGNP
jgi:tetratricopeptide (TPR) repeat protein